MGTVANKAINEEKVHAFLGKVIHDWGATLSSALVIIGDKLGLYRAMADGEPLTPVELAQRTGTAERYVREWLAAMTTGGVVEYDPGARTYRLPPEHAGEEVVVQFLLLNRFGGCGILPAGTYHLGLPTTVEDRSRNATELFAELLAELESRDQLAGQEHSGSMAKAGATKA